MRYVAIDLETTGLDPLRDQILQFGAVVGDTEQLDVAVDKFPNFTINVKPSGGRVSGDPFALAMNAGILKAIANGDAYDWTEMASQFRDWLEGVGFEVKHRESGVMASITVAGKNFGSFDLQFIRQWCPKMLYLTPFRHRYLDVGSLWAEAADSVMPDLMECKRRAGIVGPVAHNAVDDALDVVACVQEYFRRRAATDDLIGASRRLVSTPAHSDAFPGMVTTVQDTLERLL